MLALSLILYKWSLAPAGKFWMQNIQNSSDDLYNIKFSWVFSKTI